MSAVRFISDLHLDPARPAVTRALADFLLASRHCRQLYILGDLFEAWPGDDDDSALAREVIALLHDCSAAGTELLVLHGNRDFLLGSAFCAATGARLLAEPVVIDLYGRPTLLLHGDSLCTADTDYQRFRQTVRDPAWQARLLTQPLAERRALATRLRALSRDAGRIKPEEIMDVTPAAVSRAMRALGVDRLVHGHTHRPARHDTACGERWVLGAWDDRGWFIEADETRFELNNFPIYQ